MIRKLRYETYLLPSHPKNDLLLLNFHSTLSIIFSWHLKTFYLALQLTLYIFISPTNLYTQSEGQIIIGFQSYKALVTDLVGLSYFIY